MKNFFDAGAEPGSWGVVCLCSEPLPLLLAYAAHHVKMGARRVHLYLDTPDAEAEAALGEIDEVVLTVCDSDFWRGELGLRWRPRNSQKRQLQAVAHAMEETDVAWLAHVDCDEFLHGRGNMSAFLNAQPAHVLSVSFENIERVFVQGTAQHGLFDGLYRHALPRSLEEGEVHDIYGETARYLSRGLTGYALYKSVMRTDAGLLPGIHSPRFAAQRPNEMILSEAFRVLHFDGLTGLHWASKLLRFCTAPLDRQRKQKLNNYRFSQMEYVEANFETNRGAVLALHDELKTLSAYEMGALAERGLLEPKGPNIAAAVHALGLGHVATLTADEFDAALIARDPHLAEVAEAGALAKAG